MVMTKIELAHRQAKAEQYLRLTKPQAFPCSVEWDVSLRHGPPGRGEIEFLILGDSVDTMIVST